MLKLRASNIHMSYGQVEVLKGVSFDLHQGEVVVLLGASGSGKTTLLRTIAGFETPAQGEIIIENREVFGNSGITNLAPERRNLGMVFQSYALWPHKTVEQNLSYGLNLRGADKASVAKSLREASATLGLTHLAGRYPNELSGGQQQRVALARALIYGAPVVLMDEPLSNLDAQLREEAKTWLKKIIVDLNISAVMVTHDQTEALAIADRVILLSNGKVEQSGTPFEVYNRPTTHFSASFFGTNNTFDAKLSAVDADNATISVDGMIFQGVLMDKNIQLGDDVSVVIRAENVRTTQHGPQSECFAKVTSMFMGTDWQHILRRGQLELKIISREALPAGEFSISLDKSKLWIFPKQRNDALHAI